MKYRSKTLMIITALATHKAHPEGTVWEPQDAIEAMEARELVLLGFAEEYDGPIEPALPTPRNNGKPISSLIVKPVKQPPVMATVPVEPVVTTTELKPKRK